MFKKETCLRLSQLNPLPTVAHQHPLDTLGHVYIDIVQPSHDMIRLLSPAKLVCTLQLLNSRMLINSTVALQNWLHQYRADQTIREIIF